MKAKLWSLILVAGVSSLAVCEENPVLTERTTVTETTMVGYASPLHMGLDLQYVPAQFPNYAWAANQRRDQFGMGGRVAMEWIPFGDALVGKFGIGVGLGYSNLRDVALNTTTKAALGALPIDASLSYRMDIFHNQAFVPFARVGVTRTFVKQTNYTNTLSTATPIQEYDGYEYALGVSFNLGVLDPGSARVLDHEIGINRTYLNFEYLSSSPFRSSGGPNLARTEYRFGVRFEM